jgi:hypothetical protein
MIFRKTLSSQLLLHFSRHSVLLQQKLLDVKAAKSLEGADIRGAQASEDAPNASTAKLRA